MMRKDALILLSIGIVVLVLGFLLTFFWIEGLQQGWHVVKADGAFEISWYLQNGDRTEGSFNVSGGNRQAKVSVKNPSGVIIWARYANGSYHEGFTVKESGIYTMIFENLDPVNDQSIYVGFLSPYEPRLTVYDGIGLLTMLGSVAILFFGIRALSE